MKNKFAYLLFVTLLFMSEQNNIRSNFAVGESDLNWGADSSLMSFSLGEVSSIALVGWEIVVLFETLLFFFFLKKPHSPKNKENQRKP